MLVHEKTCSGDIDTYCIADKQLLRQERQAASLLADAKYKSMDLVINELVIKGII